MKRAIVLLVVAAFVLSSVAFAAEKKAAAPAVRPAPAAPATATAPAVAAPPMAPGMPARAGMPTTMPKFVREAVKFVGVGASKEPGKKTITVVNKEGKQLKIEVPEYLKIRKMISLSELRRNEEIIVNYRVIDNKNEAISIAAGEMAPPRPPMAVRGAKGAVPGTSAAEKKSWWQKLLRR